MAMTKKEQAAMKAAIDRADTLAALRWTAPVEKDVPPPTGVSHTEGWDYNLNSGVVERWWSTTASHGRGSFPEPGKYRSGSQNPRWLFSTKEKAIAAMRHEVEKIAASRLLAVDRLLSKETSEAGE